jgi:hypothetical protein
MTSPIREFVRPRPALADCLSPMVVGDTRGCALDQTQRFNFHPASAFPAVAWTFAGDWHVIDQPDQMERPWTGAWCPNFAFTGATARAENQLKRGRRLRRFCDRRAPDELSPRRQAAEAGRDAEGVVG